MANSRMAKVVMVRSDQHASLPLKDFLVVFNEGWSFIIRCEVMARKMIVGLRGVMMSQVLVQVQQYLSTSSPFSSLRCFLSLVAQWLDVSIYVSHLLTNNFGNSFAPKQKLFRLKLSFWHFIMPDSHRRRLSLKTNSGLKWRFRHRLNDGPIFSSIVPLVIHQILFCTRLQQRRASQEFLCHVKVLPQVLPVPGRVENSCSSKVCRTLWLAQP